MKLSIITATYNALEHLPNLIESLRNQEDKDFEWIVADGSSNDGSLELLNSIKDINININSEKDFGIYDALNRGIKISKGDFYLIVGADDYLYPNAVKDYKNAIENNMDADIITACIDSRNKTTTSEGHRSSWLFAQFSYISGHAVGSIYRKKLHEIFGFYSKKFPIAADQLFVLNSVKGGAKIKRIKSIVGFFNDVGVSSVDVVGALTELYRIQLIVGESKFLQTILFIIRLIKNYKKL